MKIVLFVFAAILALIAVQKARQKDWSSAAACAAVVALDLWVAMSVKSL